MNNTKRWFIVVGYAAAMAWVESAVVFYLRTMFDRIDPYQPDPLPMSTGLGRAELVREAATLMMLLLVGVLAGRNWRSRLGYAAVAFGTWDIFYYVFLKVLCGWPNSLLDWDVLFLLPLPWWGPVLAPMSIALLMIVWGTLACQSPVGAARRATWNWRWGMVSASGAGLALYVFMADAIRVAEGGVPALRAVLPQQFNWPLFTIALLLMAVPVIEQATQFLPPKFKPQLNPRTNK